MDKIAKQHTTKLVILSIITVLLITAGFLGLRQMNKWALRVVDVKERIATYEQNKKTFEEEIVQMRDLEKRLGVLGQYLVTPTSLPSYLSGMEELAKVDGVDFQIKSVTTPGEADKKKLVIDFEATATEEVIFSFLEKLTKQPGVVDITKLVLNRGLPQTEEGDQSAFARWQATGTLEVISFTP